MIYKEDPQFLMSGHLGNIYIPIQILANGDDIIQTIDRFGIKRPLEGMALILIHHADDPRNAVQPIHLTGCVHICVLQIAPDIPDIADGALDPGR